VDAARRAQLERINKTQLALDNGQLNDPEFSKFVDELLPYVNLQESTEDYYDLVRAPRGKRKVYLQAKERPHGLSKDPSTYRALFMAERQARSGKSAAAPPAKDLTTMTKLLQDLVMPTSINSVGSLGSRKRPTDEQMLLRAASLLTDVDRGYDPVTGAAFNGMPLDAGHIQSHISHPELSNDPYNIRFQNAYENKGQSAAEKIAGREKRDPTGEEIANMLWKTIVNRTIDGTKLPRKNSKAYHAYMDPINAKVEAARMAGQIFA